jgi:hypothetical protein
MEIKQITLLDADTIVQISELFEKIEHLQIISKDYFQYLSKYLSSGLIGLFAVQEDDKIIGFIHTECPHPLKPKTGYIGLASNGKPLSSEIRKKTINAAEQWLSKFGATEWTGMTYMDARAHHRLYGTELNASEHYMTKQIDIERNI